MKTLYENWLELEIPLKNLKNIWNIRISEAYAFRKSTVKGWTRVKIKESCIEWEFIDARFFDFYSGLAFFSSHILLV